MLLAHTNDTVTQLNRHARNRLAPTGRLVGPTLEAGERVYQAGDRILCRRNQSRLGVLNGDLATVTGVDEENQSLTVCLDRDAETRELPGWYLGCGHVDYGYAMTGHKAQGATTGRTFVVVDGATDREWAYVAMSRGRKANTLYLANPKPANGQCTHLTHTDSHEPLEDFTAALGRISAQSAAIDQAGPQPGDDIDPMGSAAAQ